MSDSGLVLLSDVRAEKLAEQIEALGPNASLVAIYGMNNRHWAWMKIETQAPKEPSKKNKKGLVDGNSR